MATNSTSSRERALLEMIFHLGKAFTGAKDKSANPCETGRSPNAGIPGETTMYDPSPQTRFAPMQMGNKLSDYGVVVEYSRDCGFRAYQQWNNPPGPEKDVWTVYLGVPQWHRELEAFRDRLALFSRNERDHAEIVNFLEKALLETWNDALATEEDRSHQDYPRVWEDYVCDCCSDLSAWMCDREYLFVWDGWEDCWYTNGDLSGW